MDSTLRSARAAAILERHLGGRSLPPHLPGDPVSLIAAIVGSASAKRALRELGDLYAVRTWDGPAFRRHVLEDALPAWREGARVVDADGHMLVLAPECPFRADAATDPRVCAHCRAATAALVASAVDGVKAETLATVLEGSNACVLRIEPADPQG